MRLSLPIDDIPRQHHLDIIKCYRELMSLRLVRLKLGYKDKSYVHQVIKRYAPEIMRRPYEHFSWESSTLFKRNRADRQNRSKKGTFKKGYKNAT